jgi:hypothetical protein
MHPTLIVLALYALLAFALITSATQIVPMIGQMLTTGAYPPWPPGIGIAHRVTALTSFHNHSGATCAARAMISRAEHSCRTWPWSRSRGVCRWQPRARR